MHADGSHTTLEDRSLALAPALAVSHAARSLPSAPAATSRHGTWDALLAGLALAHGALLWVAPSAALIALGLWWNSNTIAHWFIHRPFFASPALNRLFSLYQTLLLGVPQSLWRARHLAHHAGRPPRLRPSAWILVETALVLFIWIVLAARAPGFFWTVYLPGYLAGLALCQAHGYFEHWRGATTSHYGWLYNRLFFNDGYHREHHAAPGRHWRELPKLRRAETAAEQHGADRALASRWPACLRWLELLNLDSLERLVLRSPALQHLVLAAHRRAFARLLPRLGPVRRVTVVGGGLFPRTALILRDLLPRAEVRVIDANRRHLETARPFLDPAVQLEEGFWRPEDPVYAELVILPLALIGDRRRMYRRPPPCALLVHDWIWRRRGVGVVVSWLLLKRLNLIRAARDA